MYHGLCLTRAKRHLVHARRHHGTFVVSHLHDDESKGGDAHHLPDLLHQLLHGDDLGALLCRAVKHRVLSNQQVANAYEEAAAPKIKKFKSYSSLVISSSFCCTCM